MRLKSEPDSVPNLKPFTACSKVAVSHSDVRAVGDDNRGIKLLLGTIRIILHFHATIGDDTQTDTNPGQCRRRVH
jgi:hypothetical protein